jgi:hypothetical protein
MIGPTHAHKEYASAHRRFLTAAIGRFLEELFPRWLGPRMRDRAAVELTTIVDAHLPAATHLRPGQCLWNAIAVDTRADSSHLRLIPVMLTLATEEDVHRLAAGESFVTVRRDLIARLLLEAYAQDALLSMRDLSLLLWLTPSAISHERAKWEAAHDMVLPHPGSLQDMGTCLTHKTTIVTKVVYEHKDPRTVARETCHTQPAVDRYLKDFHRVRTCYLRHPDLDFVCQTTGMSRHLVQQYIAILAEKEGPTEKTETPY